MDTPFLGGGYLSRVARLNSQRSVNLFLEVVETQDGKELGGLIGCPGLDGLATVGNGPIRGFAVSADRTKLYVASGYGFYEVTLDFSVHKRGDLISGQSPVSIARNNSQVMVVDGLNGYIYTPGTGAFAAITDPDFPGANQVAFIDQYFAFNRPNTGQWGITALADGSSVDALDIVTAEGSPDNALGILVDHGEVWIPGTESTEVWVPNPAEEFPFSRSQIIESGVASAWTMQKGDNTVFWVDADGVVRRANGNTPVRISTHWVERMLRPVPGAVISDLIAFFEVYEGHAFYHVTSPTQGVTLVYDVAASALAGVPMWHERAYRVPATNQLTRERANRCVAFAGRNIVGDFQSGRIYALNLDTFDDDGDTRKWLRSWRGLPTGQSSSKPVFINRLYIDLQPGVGLPTGQGSNPECMLRVSRDGGKTWGNELTRSMGAQGAYNASIEFGPLGQARDPVFELSGTDPVLAALVGAQMDAEMGD